MNLEEELESIYEDQFINKIKKQALIELGIPSSALESEQKILDTLTSKIDSYEIPQNIKDKIQLKTYHHYLESLEDLKTSESIFGHCFQCEYIKFDDVNLKEELYCLKGEKDFYKIRKEGLPCLNRKEADPEKMNDTLRLEKGLNEECQNDHIVIAKQILESLKQEFANKYLHKQDLWEKRI